MKNQIASHFVHIHCCCLDTKFSHHRSSLSFTEQQPFGNLHQSLQTGRFVIYRIFRVVLAPVAASSPYLFVTSASVAHMSGAKPGYRRHTQNSSSLLEEEEKKEDAEEAKEKKIGIGSNTYK